MSLSSLLPELSKTLAAEELQRSVKHALKEPSRATELAAKLAPRGVTPRGVRRSLTKDHKKLLREILFVRVLSALEVFLIDTVRWLFMHRRELFHRKDRIELRYAELLASTSLAELFGRLISRECRRLQNRGFAEIRKYYSQRFGIDLAGAGIPMSDIEEMHERRHLLVHRLGKTDVRYRHTYQPTTSRVTVTEPYLLSAIDAAEKLSFFVHRRVQNLIRQGARAPFDPRQFNLRVDLAGIEDEAELFFDPEYRIPGTDPATMLRDILVSQIGDSEERMIVLSGKKAVVKRYLEQLHKSRDRGEMIMQNKTILGRGYRCRLTADQVAVIAQRLPPLPLPRDIHRTIAGELRLSNKQVSAAIGMILETPEAFRPNSGEVAG